LAIRRIQPESHRTLRATAETQVEQFRHQTIVVGVLIVNYLSLVERATTVILAQKTGEASSRIARATLG